MVLNVLLFVFIQNLKDRPIWGLFYSDFFILSSRHPLVIVSYPSRKSLVKKINNLKIVFVLFVCPGLAIPFLHISKTDLTFFYLYIYMYADFGQK